MPRGQMMQETKEELKDKVKQLNKKLKNLEAENEELKKEKESRKGDADYISWLQLNCEHLSRFIRENVEVNTEVDYDYYGNASNPYSSIEVRKPSELE